MDNGQGHAFSYIHQQEPIYRHYSLPESRPGRGGICYKPKHEPASVLLERIKAEKEQLIKEGKIKRSKKTAKTSDTPNYPAPQTARSHNGAYV